MSSRPFIITTTNNNKMTPKERKELEKKLSKLTDDLEKSIEGIKKVYEEIWGEKIE